MTKRDFDSFIKPHLKSLAPDEQIKFLEIVEDWIHKLKAVSYAKLEKTYLKCSKCNKYSLKSKYKLELWVKETLNGVCVHTDAGYGDNDVFADVTYFFDYYICPLCGGKTEKARHYHSTTNRRNRWGDPC